MARGVLGYRKQISNDNKKLQKQYEDASEKIPRLNVEAAEITNQIGYLHGVLKSSGRLFGQLPQTFVAQMGHFDRAEELPQGVLTVISGGRIEDRVERARLEIADERSVERLAEAFGILGDPTRLKMLMVLIVWKMSCVAE